MFKSFLKPKETKSLPDGIVLFDALNTNRVIWSECIEMHNDCYFLPLRGWYSLSKHGWFKASVTRIDNKLYVNLYDMRVSTTDYALRFPEDWIEVYLVYEQELPFDE